MNQLIESMDQINAKQKQFWHEIWVFRNSFVRTRATNAMRMSVNVPRHVVIYHGPNGGNIQTSRGDIRGHEDQHLLLLELMQHLVAFRLVQISVNQSHVMVRFPQSIGHVFAVGLLRHKNQHATGRREGHDILQQPRRLLVRIGQHFHKLRHVLIGLAQFT